MNKFKVEKSMKGNDQMEVEGKVFHNGYYFTFKDMDVYGHIKICESEGLTTTILLPIFDEEDGIVDLTSVVNEYNRQVKESPDKKVSVCLTGFSRKIHFSKKLLSRPIHDSISQMFDLDK